MLRLFDFGRQFGIPEINQARYRKGIRVSYISFCLGSNEDEKESKIRQRRVVMVFTLPLRPFSTERPLLTSNESFILGELFSPLFRISTHLHLHQTQTLLRLCPSPRPMNEILRVAATANSLLRPKPEAEHRFDEQQSRFAA